MNSKRIIIFVIISVLLVMKGIDAQDETNDPCYLDFICRDMYTFFHEGKEGTCCTCHCTYPGDLPRCDIGC